VGFERGLHRTEHVALDVGQELLGHRRLGEVQPALGGEVDHVAFEDGATHQPLFLAAGQLLLSVMGQNHRAHQ
jgi:hypothetical protein